MKFKYTLFIINIIISVVFFYNSAYCSLNGGYFDGINNRPEIDSLGKINYYKDFPKRIISYNYIRNKKTEDVIESIDYKFKSNLLVEQTIIFNLKEFPSEKANISKYKYEYEKEKLVKILVYRSQNLNDLDKKLINTIVITYNDKNRIQSITNFDNELNNPNNKDIDEFLYNNNLNIIRYVKTSYNPFNNKMELSIEADYIYKNNKLVNAKIKNVSNSEEYTYEYPSNNTIIERSKDKIVTCSYSKKGLPIKEIKKNFRIDVETKYEEVDIEYDNKDRVKTITLQNYNDPNNKFKEYSRYNFIKEFIYDEIKKAKITASDNLRLRKEASADSEKITLIPSNETVEVIQESGNQTVINGKTGKWVKIKWKSYEGWVFDAYLKYE